MGETMRLISRHKHQRRQATRIALTQEEIAADLHYPAQPPRGGRDAGGKGHAAK